jgi:hypothetical protein
VSPREPLENPATLRERFLAEIKAVVPWKTLTDLIDPYDPPQ